jgi:hypothetical protein
MLRKSTHKPAGNRTSALFIDIGMFVLVALGLLAMQSGAIETLNASGLLGR